MVLRHQQVSGAAQGAQHGSQQQQHATSSLQGNARSMSNKLSGPDSGQLPQSSGSQQDQGTPCSAEQLQKKQLVGQGSALLKLLTEHILQQQQQKQQQTHKQNNRWLLKFRQRKFLKTNACH